MVDDFRDADITFCNDRLYDEKVGEVRRLIAEGVVRRMDAKYKSVEDFAKKHCMELGLRKESCKTYIGAVRSGKSPNASMVIGRNRVFTELELERLSKLFKVLKIKKKDDLVSRLLDYDKRFEYSLKGE